MTEGLDRYDRAVQEQRHPPELRPKDIEVERRDAPDYNEPDWREITPLPQTEEDGDG